MRKKQVLKLILDSKLLGKSHNGLLLSVPEIPQKPFVTLTSSLFALKVVTMMSSVSAAMAACDAGSLEMIPGWNTLNGFLGQCC